MEIERTQRGFSLLKFKDSYNNPCSLQKSSAMSDDYIWLGVDDLNPQIMALDAPRFGIQTTQDCGWVPYPIPKEVCMWNRMHLSREQVKELLPHLQRFVETGEL